MAHMEDPAADSPSSTDDTEKLWADLEEALVCKCESHETIDDALRTWLELATKLGERSLDSQEQVATCGQMLLHSSLFQNNKDYVRTQIIYSLLQEDEVGALHAITCLLLLDGHYDESAYSRMIDESCFPRLLELIGGRSPDPRLHRLLLHLMYEMSRVERLTVEHLREVNDEFIHSLFRIIEGVSDDVDDPYHYPTIRVLLVLNEQYMLASTDAVEDTDEEAPLTNRIVKCLSHNGPDFKTFGENIILLLNRETETSLQLLILKLLYLLFTTSGTYEYFYTNDLRVLLDVIIRNLMDLPDEKISLRHTYLRVMYPLLAHTQLNQPPYYKQDEIFRVLKILRGSQNAHFAPADDTTIRLVDRVSKVRWVEEADHEKEGAGEAEVARKLLGISLSRSESASSVSVVDVAEVMEKPGVQTPSRNADAPRATEANAKEAIATPTRVRKPLPALPPHRQVRVNPLTNGTVKKIPPKAPPPRRKGRLQSAGNSPIDPVKEAVSEQGA